MLGIFVEVMTIDSTSTKSGYADHDLMVLSEQMEEGMKWLTDGQRYQKREVGQENFGIYRNSKECRYMWWSWGDKVLLVRYNNLIHRRLMIFDWCWSNQSQDEGVVCSCQMHECMVVVGLIYVVCRLLWCLICVICCVSDGQFDCWYDVYFVCCWNGCLYDGCCC